MLLCLGTVCIVSTSMLKSLHLVLMIYACRDTGTMVSLTVIPSELALGLGYYHLRDPLQSIPVVYEWGECDAKWNRDCLET